jgi:hypothetical protein
MKPSLHFLPVHARDRQGTMYRTRALFIPKSRYRVDEVPDEEVIRAIREISFHRAALDFGVPFLVVATSSTASTVAGVKTPANQAVTLWGFDIGFDGTTSTNGPAKCEVGTCTFATNSPGTNSTSVTPVAFDSGRPETIQSTAGKAWTSEPTVISSMEAFYIPSYMGSGIIFQPLAHPVTAKGGNGAILRVTQQTSVTPNASGTLKLSE